MRKAAQLILTNTVIFLVLLLIAELVARLFVVSYSDHKEFRLTQPAPYKNAPYFSKDFIEESFAQPGGWITKPGTNLIFPKDFSGRFFTVKNGVRRTTDTPPQANRTIYLFGGSTAYSSEVPDGYTIASHLQRLLVKNNQNIYRVVNLGVTSVSTNQQLERLYTTKLTRGDIVIFYDGINDVVQGVLYGNAGNTIFGNDKSRPAWQKLLSKLSENSVLARYFLTRMNANYRIANLDKRVADTLARYSRNLGTAQRTSETQGARFLHFLQPTLYSLSPLGDYEKHLLSVGIIPTQTKQAFVAAYPSFARLVKERAAQGNADFDLTGIFDKLNEPIYLDFCHINHVGNETVARHIYTGLIDSMAIAEPVAGKQDKTLRPEQATAASSSRKYPMDDHE